METTLHNVTGGLQITPYDGRDFSLGAIIDLPKLETLPVDFAFEALSVKHQKDTDFCTGAQTTGMSELQEGEELSFEWSFAASKKITRDISAWGQNIREGMLTHVKFGAVPKKLVPYSVENKDTNFLRDIDNYPNLFEPAKIHKKQSVFRVTGPYDHFDNIRASMFYFRAEKRAVGSGVVWSWPLAKVMLESIGEGVGHAIYYRGWKTIDGIPYLILQNSYGPEAGEDGSHYISREAVNKFVDIYGAFMFIDLPRADAEYHLENGIKLTDHWFICIMKVIKTLLSKLKPH